MKITDVKVLLHTAPFEQKHKSESRQVGPMDFYDEYRTGQRSNSFRGTSYKSDGMLTQAFVVISTDEGIEGVHGPVDYRVQVLTILDGLKNHLIGRDPMETRTLWDIMSRFDRHSRSGGFMMAISALDVALWDLKGKILGQPVYKVLGGGRQILKPYFSMLAYSVEPDKAAERAKWVKEMGVQAQKWFFRYGPGDGAEGMKKNLDMAFAVRDAVGEGYELMFDCWMGWDVAYAKMIFQELKKVKPMWVEEVLRPHMRDAYKKLRADTDVPLSAGEHLYTRMEVNEYLYDGIFDVMQSDPEWSGGITETMRLVDLCEIYGVRLIPHGHLVLPSMHVVAASSPEVCPYVEILYHHFTEKTWFYKESCLTDDGLLRMNDTPGLGEDLDMERIVKTEEVTSMTF